MSEEEREPADRVWTDSEGSDKKHDRAEQHNMMQSSHRDVIEVIIYSEAYN